MERQEARIGLEQAMGILRVPPSLPSIRLGHHKYIYCISVFVWTNVSPLGNLVPSFPVYILVYFSIQQKGYNTELSLQLHHFCFKIGSVDLLGTYY